jgi:hypothetical protein
MKPALVVISLLLAASAKAAPPSLLEHVPDGALLAGSVEPSALELSRAWFGQSADMQKDLGAYFVKRLGVDLTRVDGVAFWSTQLGPQSTFGAYLRLRDAAVPSLHGTKKSTCEATELVAFGGKLSAAAQPGGLLVGDETEVCLGLAVAHRHAPALSGKSALAPLLGQARGAALAGGLATAAVRDPQLQQVAQTLGIKIATVQLRDDGQIIVEVSGDAQKLKNAQAMIDAAMKAQLAQLKRQHDLALADDKSDFAAGLGAVAGYDQGAAFWKEFAPRLEGDKLVSRYQLPQLKTSGMFVPAIGIMAAVAIPAFTKYIRRSKSVEATMNLRRLATGATAFAAVEAPKKKARFSFPKSTGWTPARGCCGQPGDKCAPDASAWQDASFRALDFSVDEPHYYQYRVVSTGTGKKARVSVEARGDLDCDGVASSFSRVVTLDAQGNASVGEMQSSNETE